MPYALFSNRSVAKLKFPLNFFSGEYHTRVKAVADGIWRWILSSMLLLFLRVHSGFSIQTFNSVLFNFFFCGNLHDQLHQFRCGRLSFYVTFFFPLHITPFWSALIDLNRETHPYSTHTVNRWNKVYGFGEKLLYKKRGTATLPSLESCKRCIKS